MDKQTTNQMLVNTWQKNRPTLFTKRQSGEAINTETSHQEIEQEIQLNRIDDTSRETNPYKELIINNAGKIEILLTQMEQWAILRNTLNYIQ